MIDCFASLAMTVIDKRFLSNLGYLLENLSFFKICHYILYRKKIVGYVYQSQQLEQVTAFSMIVLYSFYN